MGIMLYYVLLAVFFITVFAFTVWFATTFWDGGDVN